MWPEYFESSFAEIVQDTFVSEMSKTTNMESPNEEKFIPKGAMAFFILLVILALLFWYGIYLLMIDRV